MITPEEVHKTHDVREEGLLVSDPVCQKCRYGAFEHEEQLRLPCITEVAQILKSNTLPYFYPDVPIHWEDLAIRIIGALYD